MGLRPIPTRSRPPDGRQPSALPGLDYGITLRCIGQDLEIRAIKTFDLTVENRRCVVQCGYQPPPAATPVTLHYTERDIEELDESGREQRGTSAAATEFLRLSQVLRAIGGFLEKNRHILIRLSNNHSDGQQATLRLEYETRDGVRVVDNRPASAIYDMCVSMYKMRGKATPRTRNTAR